MLASDSPSHRLDIAFTFKVPIPSGTKRELKQTTWDSSQLPDLKRAPCVSSVEGQQLLKLAAWHPTIIVCRHRPAKVAHAFYKSTTETTARLWLERRPSSWGNFLTSHVQEHSCRRSPATSSHPSPMSWRSKQCFLKSSRPGTRFQASLMTHWGEGEKVVMSIEIRVNN